MTTPRQSALGLPDVGGGDGQLRKCDGLDAGQLARRAMEPSTMSLLGLVRHMAKVERGWFRRHSPAMDQAQRLALLSTGASAKVSSAGLADVA